jgi:Mannose-6-phosphate isomerase
MVDGTNPEQAIANPVTGVTIGEPRTDQPEGTARVTMRPGASGPPAHIHPETEERFEVVEGPIVFHIDGRERSLSAGTEVRVAPETAHTFRNETDGEVMFRVRTLPSNERLGEVVATLFGLAQEGETDEAGRPGLLQGAVMAEATIDDVYFADAPRGLQRSFGSVLGPIGRALGYSPTYEEYLTEEYWEGRTADPGDP